MTLWLAVTGPKCSDVERAADDAVAEEVAVLAAKRYAEGDEVGAGGRLELEPCLRLRHAEAIARCAVVRKVGDGFRVHALSVEVARPLPPSGGGAVAGWAYYRRVRT